MQTHPEPKGSRSTSSQNWPFPIFMDLKVEGSHAVSHQQKATLYYSKLATGQAQARWQQGNKLLCVSCCLSNCVSGTYPALQHLELAAVWCFFPPSMKTEVKHLGTAVNSECINELKCGHLRAAQWQCVWISQRSDSVRAIRNIKVSTPIRDPAWHLLLSTRNDSTWNNSHHSGTTDYPAAFSPPTMFLPLDYLHATRNKNNRALLPV